MNKMIYTTIAIALIAMIAGCQEGPKDDERFQVSPADQQFVMTEGFKIAGPEEIMLVEEMAGTRIEYRQAVAKLLEYYLASGDDVKRRWAQHELASIDSIAQYRYLMAGEAASAKLNATQVIPEADALYEEAMKLYSSSIIVVVVDESKMRSALAKFNKIIDQYSNSDKIDDAAYRAGRIYEHFKDYELAAVYYQRAFQWDDDTPYPARFRAAYILDKKLQDRDEALIIYKMAYEKEFRYEENTDYAKLRIKALSKPQEPLEVQEQAPEEEPAEEK